MTDLDHHWALIMVFSLVYSSMLLGYSAAPCCSCQTGQIKLAKGYHILHHALLQIHKGARTRSRLNNCTMSCVSLAGLDNCCCNLTLEAAAFLTILRSPLPCAPAQRRPQTKLHKAEGCAGPSLKGTRLVESWSSGVQSWKERCCKLQPSCGVFGGYCWDCMQKRFYYSSF